MTNHLIFPTPIMEDRIESDLEQYVTELSKGDEGEFIQTEVDTNLNTSVNQKKNFKIYGRK